MKKTVSWLLILSMLVSMTTLFVTSATAETVIWNGTAASSYAGGTGTKDDPYLIATAAQLAKMQGSSIGSRAYYKLTADIYLNDVSNMANWNDAEWRSANLHAWNPAQILRYGFDGDNHTIYGLYMVSTGAKCMGFFQEISEGCVLKNLHLGAGLIIGDYTGVKDCGIGSLVGDIAGDATITGCTSDVDITLNANINLNDYTGIGGIAGSVIRQHVVFENCTYTGDIKVNNTGKGELLGVGGILGQHAQVQKDSVASVLEVKGCVNEGNITETKAGTNNAIKGVGGILGELGYGTDRLATVTVTDCQNFGKINAYNASGIVGFHRNGSMTVEKCFNFGEISGAKPHGIAYSWIGFTMNNCYYTNANAGSELGMAGAAITGSDAVKMEFSALGATIRNCRTEFFDGATKVAEGQGLLFGFTFASDLTEKSYGYKLGVIFGDAETLTWENKQASLEVKHGTYNAETKMTEFSGYLIGIDSTQLSTQYSARAYLADADGNVVMYSDVLVKSVSGVAAAKGGSLDAQGNFIAG